VTFNRDTLVAAILAFIGGSDERLTLTEVRSQLEREIEGAGTAALLELSATGWFTIEPRCPAPTSGQCRKNSNFAADPPVLTPCRP
jgi:hypothetical protein